MIAIRRARQEDIPLLTKLLTQAEVSERGLNAHWEHFFVAEKMDDVSVPQVVGTIGMEQYGTDGLVRSLVIEKGNQSTKLVLELLNIVLSYGKQIGCTSLYLVAGAMNPLFEQLGFREAEHGDIPEDVRLSMHVQRSLGRGLMLVYDDE